MRRYWTNVCGACAIKHQCTPIEQRRVTRWMHSAAAPISRGTPYNRPLNSGGPKVWGAPHVMGREAGVGTIQALPVSRTHGLPCGARGPDEVTREWGQRGQRRGQVEVAPRNGNSILRRCP